MLDCLKQLFRTIVGLFKMGSGRYSDTSLFRQFTVPKFVGIPGVGISKFRYSEMQFRFSYASFIRQCDSPTRLVLYSDNPFPTVVCSDNGLFVAALLFLEFHTL